MTEVRALWAFLFRRKGLRAAVIPPIAVALLPTLVAWFASGSEELMENLGALGIYGALAGPMILSGILPFLTLMVMLPLSVEPLEKGTAAYLLTRPLPRWKVILGFFLGGTSAMAIPLLAGILGPALVLLPASPEAGPMAARILGLGGVVLLGTLPYASLTLMVATSFRKPLPWALGLVIAWGSVAGSITGPLRATSPHRYLHSLLREWCDVPNTWEGLGKSFSIPDLDPPGVPLSLAVLLGSTALFLFLAWKGMQRRDIL